MASNLEFVNYNDFVESLSERTDVKPCDKFVVSNATDGPGSKIISEKKDVNGTFFYSIFKNALSVRIDNSFNVVSGWKGSVIPVPSGMNKIELDNPASNIYAYRVYFLTSNSLVAGTAAPVVYPVKTEIVAGNKKELSIPFGCSYVFVSVYEDIPVNYRFQKDDSIVPVFTIGNTELKADGSIGTQSNQKLFVIETKKLDCPFVRFSKISDNYFKSAYSTDESVVVGETIALYEGSELGTQFAPFDTNVEVDVPIPAGVNFIILSAYNTASFEVSKSYKKKKVEQFIVCKKVETDSKIQDIKTPSAFGDDVIFRATSTYDASIADIAVIIMSPSGSFASVGYMSYGRLYTKVKSPLASLYRVRFGTGDASGALPIVYRIEVGPLLSYSESKFTFASLNAGCFDHGESTGPTNPPEYGPEFVASWLGLLKEIDADVIMFCEWNIRMTTGDDFFSKRKLLNNFPCVQEYLTGGYAKNAVASRFDTTKYTTVVFENQYSESSNRNFSFVKINVCGNDVVLVITHLELTSELRTLQIAELIEYFKNEKHVIIGGDFNCANIGEYEPFTKAGYDMANGDMWGVVYTYVGNSVSPAVDYPTDNIVVKGLKMNGPRFPYDTNATDHKAVVADIYLI